MNLEKAVGTTDCTDITDKQGLELGTPHTRKVSGLPRGKLPFQLRPSVKSVKSVVKATAAFRLKDGIGEGHNRVAVGNERNRNPG